jgi:hypothetical protein
MTHDNYASVYTAAKEIAWLANLRIKNWKAYRRQVSLILDDRRRYDATVDIDVLLAGVRAMKVEDNS